MIVMVRENATADERDALRAHIEGSGVRVRGCVAGGRALLVCLADRRVVEALRLESHPAVAGVAGGGEPNPLAARRGAESTIVRVGGAQRTAIGDGAFTVIAGPCAVESEAMLRSTAHAVRHAGASLLRGGAFKPRTSPYSFQGLGQHGLEILAAARAETGLPIVTEVMDARQIDAMIPCVDVFQVGARNMQNFSLLAELGRVRRPVLLKRGASATIEELLLAAEHILAHGNGDVILCERGVRGRETRTRNTLDIAAIPVLKAATHLPVLVDPSHAAGRADLVAPLTLAALAVGADGVIVEVHPSPAEALSDGDQSLTPEQFAGMMAGLPTVAAAFGRQLATAPTGSATAWAA